MDKEMRLSKCLQIRRKYAFRLVCRYTRGYACIWSEDTPADTSAEAAEEGANEATIQSGSQDYSSIVLEISSIGPEAGSICLE